MLTKVWSSLGGGSEVRTSVRTSIALRGTVGGCAEILDLTCSGQMALEDGHRLTVDIRVTIEAVTLNLMAVEVMEGLNAHCLARRLRWFNSRTLH